MGGHTKTVVDVCAGWKPIYTSCGDILTNPTSVQIVNHDEYGAREKCWPKPKPNPNVCKKKSSQPA